MRKTIILILAASSLFSSPVGNPANPGLMNSGLFITSNPWIKITTGYQADYVSNIPLALSNGNNKIYYQKPFRAFGMHSQSATFSLVLLQRLETYYVFGGSKEHLHWHKRPPKVSDFIDFQSDYHFSWATGMRVILIQWGQTFLSVDGSYFSVPSSQKSFFRFFNRLKLPMDQQKQHFSLREWQTGAALSTHLWIFSPYVGVKYFNAKMQIQKNPTLDYRNTKNIGYYYGLTISLTSKFLITGERRLSDEFAYVISTQAVF